MDAQNYWFSSGSAGGGGNEGDPIGQSVRLRGATNCWFTRTFSNNGNQEVYTLSGWMKPSLNDVAVNQGGPMINLLGTGSGGNGQANFAFFETTSQFFSNTTNNFTVFSASVNRAFRDPSAWYHVVVSYNSPAANAADRFRVWINGELQTFNAGATLPAQDADSPVNSGFREMFIGCFNATAGTIPATGFIADYYFLDGTVADETDFGRFNDNGVWVPVEYDGDADDYGANGYHLTFADPDNLGADTAPTGATGHTAANNWTVGNGFNTDPVGIFSNGLTSATGFQAQLPAVNAFDGNTNTQAGTNGAGATLVFAPDPPLTNVSQVSIFSQMQAGGTLEWNGNTVNTVRDAWTNLDADPNNPATTAILGPNNTMELTSTAQSTCTLIQVRINGNRILVDNTGEDFDSMQDSPTQNFATLNPLDNHGGTTSFPNLSAASLQDDTTAVSGLTGSTIHWNNENEEYYFEFVYTGSGNEASCAPALRTAQPGQPSTRTGANSFYYRSDGRIVNGATANAGGADLATGDTWTTGDVLGTAFNPSNNRLRFFLNGDEQCDITITPTEPLQFGVYNDGITGVTVNYGQKDDFLYQPAGTVALQTQNLPAPDIADPADHFDIVLWEGNGVDNRDITGLNFEPALVWIKNRNATNLNYLVTDSRMGNNRRVICNTPNGNNAMVATTDFDTFNADGFRIGDGAEVNSNTAPNDYVAWCWFADNFNTNNNDGDIQTSIRTDVTGGFSIIQFTGTTAGDSLGHGLNAEPEFAISKCLGVGQTAWQIYHHDLGVGSFLPFTTSAMSNIANFWGAAADWNATTCGCSNNDSDNNRTNELMRWYVWHGVEGYSRFGSYTGNGNADGPFIYTGFTPRMILIRAAQTGVNGEEPWFCYDTAREPNNPADNALEWNSQNREGATQRDVDILSNGFKPRSAANQVNGNGTNYIYAAWAQMPFGGEDTPPATAR